MLEKLITFVILSLCISIIQSQIPGVSDDDLADIFDLNTATVTPTTGPTTLQGDDGDPCICVPYYMCNPDTDTINLDGEIDGFGKLDIRFNPKSCQETLEVCCKEPRTEPVPIKNNTVERTRGCGIRNKEGIDFTIKVNSGKESEYGEFPWTVALLYKSNSSSFCGGSLIHPQVVLTGAHCVSKRKVGDIKVRAGEWDTQTTKERIPHEERDVKKVITHQQFSGTSLANDMALVILSQPVQITDSINTVCLPNQNQNFETAKKCYATGWGKSSFGKAGRYAVVMKKVQLDAVDSATCQRQLQRTRLGARFKLHNTFMCAGGKKNEDTCEGDGGAPLVCPSPVPDRYFQAGIVAWGVGCGEENVPAAYAYVSKFRSWIDGHMANEGFDTSSYILVE